MVIGKNRVYTELWTILCFRHLLGCCVPCRSGGLLCLLGGGPTAGALLQVIFHPTDRLITFPSTSLLPFPELSCSHLYKVQVHLSFKSFWSLPLKYVSTPNPPI